MSERLQTVKDLLLYVQGCCKCPSCSDTAKDAIRLIESEIALVASPQAEAQREGGQVTPKMMSEVFAASVTNTDPEHEYLYDHRIAAELLNKMLSSPPSGEPGDSKPRLPVGVSVLITNGDKVLLGERQNNSAAGLLSTPGGRVEEIESILDCAVRETLEETGLSLTKDLLRVVEWREHFRFGGHYIMFYVHAPQSFGVIENREPEKCKGWNWHSIADVDANSTTEPLEILNSLLAARASVESGERLQSARWLELITEQDIREAYQSAPNWHSVLSSLQCRAIKKYQDATAALVSTPAPSEDNESKRETLACGCIPAIISPTCSKKHTGFALMLPRTTRPTFSVDLEDYQ